MVAGQGQTTYPVDIVMCIDVTGSMRPMINEVKARAIRFFDDFKKKMEEIDRPVEALRVRVVAFRDFYDDEAPALAESPFFDLPQEQTDFAAFVNTLEAKGGGSAEENGLEALAIAIRSDWTRTGTKRRHVIVMWTDTKAHELEKKATETVHWDYPPDMPKSLSELSERWEGQNTDILAKRLLIFAPDDYPWNLLANNWSNTVFFASKAGQGLADAEYDEMLTMIAGSVKG